MKMVLLSKMVLSVMSLLNAFSLFIFVHILCLNFHTFLDLFSLLVGSRKLLCVIDL